MANKNIKLDLNLTEFIQTGKFGFIELGMSKSELESQLFFPEDWLSEEGKDLSAVWRYGNFELHFDLEQNVHRIFNDYCPFLDGGKSISIIDWWVFKEKDLTLKRILFALNSMKLDYIKATDRSGNVKIHLKNKVYFGFENIDNIEGLDINEYRLIVLGKGYL